MGAWGRHIGHHSRQYVLVERADENLTSDLAIWIEGGEPRAEKSWWQHISEKEHCARLGAAHPVFLTRCG